MAAADPPTPDTVKILSAKDKKQCLCVYNLTTVIVGVKPFTNDSNSQQWNQIKLDDKYSTFQTLSGDYMCPDKRDPNPDGVRVETISSSEPPKWHVYKQGDHWVIEDENSKCITMEKESAPVKLRNRGDSEDLKYFWDIQFAA